MEYWSLLFFFLGGVFRRWLGGGYKEQIGKVHRFYKLVILVSLSMLMYYVKDKFPTNAHDWLFMAWAIGWLIRYNSHTHGDYWILDDTKPDEERSWWVGKVLKFIFGKNNYYKFEGNFIGFMLGYLAPATFASLTMGYHWFWLAGITAPVIYSLCEFTLRFTKRDTEMAEYAHGSVMFLLFFVNI